MGFVEALVIGFQATSVAGRSWQSAAAKGLRLAGRQPPAASAGTAFTTTSSSPPPTTA